MSWFPSAFFHWIPFPSDIISKVLAPLFDVQHFPNLVKINTIDHIGGRWRYSLLMFSHGGNPGPQEYCVENWVYLPCGGEFKLIGKSSDLSYDFEGHDACRPAFS
jgi:hypothetical protein